MWILLWVALIPNTQQLATYQLGTFDLESACGEALRDAMVLVSDNMQTIDCIWIEPPVKSKKN